MRNRIAVATLLVAAALAVLVAVPARSDDRDLLMSRGARPNVLMVVDSSGSMARDVDYDKRNFVAGMDDPHSKIYQVKYAVKQFVQAFPQFNLGFTFFERDNVEIGDQLFLYRLDPSGSGIDFSWQYRILRSSTNEYGSQVRMQLNAGDPVRLGDYTAASGNYQYVQRWGPLFGASGQHMFSDWTNGGTVYYNGARTGKYRVDAWLLEPTAGTGYYYPSYTWGEDNNAVPNAINAFTQVHDQYASVIFDPLASPEVKLDALQHLRTARVQLQQVLDAHQIGLRRLTMRVQLKQCSGTVNTSNGTCSTNWVTQATTDISLVSAEGTPAGAFASGDSTNGTYPATFMTNEYSYNSSGTKGTYFYTDSGGGGAYDFTYTNDCNGWLGATPSTVKIPLVPIPTDQDPPLLSLIDLTLNPSTQMRLYFPTRTDGVKSWPKYWEPKSPCRFDAQASCSFDLRGVWVTDRSMFATGSTPLKNSIDDSYQYFSQDVLKRDDPLKSCRKNFVILLTDGLETCGGNPCTAATNLWKNTKPYNVSVFVIGYGMGTSGNSLKCIADNSHGELYLPNNVQELIDALMRVGQQIDERSRGFASPTVPSVELSTREKGYISTFIPRNHRSIWEGHLRAYLVEPATGMIPTTCSNEGQYTLCLPDTTKALWDAGEVLRQRATSQRNIYFGTAGGSVPGARMDFVVSSGTSALLKARIEPTLTDSQLSQVVAFMRGDRDATIYDNPPYKLGDVFHSVPYLSGAPDCYSCYLQNANDYRTNFFLPHGKRRKVLLAGADDGMFHAFEAGFWGRDTSNYPNAYDNGTGKELWAWVPNAVMPRFDELAFGEEHYYTVDGTPTVADVFIDPTHNGTPSLDQREWRTVVLFGGRNGSDSYVCLDITKPDPYNASGVPVSATDDMPGCLSGASGCSGNYPALLWEFADRGDSDGNGFKDMAETWARPVVAWIKVKPVNRAEETRNVAIVGGGYERSLKGGNFLYIIDIETGQALLKAQMPSSVPMEIAALDFNFDSYIERIYWGDTSGGLWKLDTSKVAKLDASGKITYTSDGWQPPAKVMQVSTTQRFFQRPVIVLAGFASSGAPIFAVGLGAGDREKIFQRDDSYVNAFYMVVDREDGVVVSEANLQALNANSPAVDSTTNYLMHDTLRGWYLLLGQYEKVNTPAVAVDNQVIFSTFTPGEGTIIVPDPEHPGSFLCRESGNAKTYVVDYRNANPYGDVRAIQLPPSVAMASETIVYVGEDGKVHVLQATDNLAMVQPLPPQRLGATVLSWRER
jgi:Tfp pilus tip-associated adhesin PilY1